MLMILPLFFLACNTSENLEDDLSTFETDIQLKPDRQNIMRLIGIAANRVLERKGQTAGLYEEQSLRQTAGLRLLAGETNPETPTIEYAFDFIKIHTVTHFLSDKLNIPLVSANCGNGMIDIMVADFELFITDEKTNTLQGYISDVLIVFKGELGLYCCILNGSSSNRDSEEIVFSSHKFFNENALVKDFTLPIYEFSLKTETKTGEVFISSAVLSADGSMVSTSPVQIKKKGVVYDGDLFSINDLKTIPQLSIKAKVSAISDNTFSIDAAKEYNLKTVYFDNYTQFRTDGELTAVDKIAIGDVVVVTFDKLYPSYNPKAVIANMITK
jgi:hypothetical protein